MRSIGILQGRLSPPPPGRPQAFPAVWQDEFTRARACGFDAIEWLITAESIPDNPLLIDGGVRQLLETSGRTGVTIPSVCADCFIMRPLLRVAPALLAARIALLERIVARSAEAGAAVVLLPVLEGNMLRSASDALDLIGALDAPLTLAERLGVLVALESDWGADALAALVDRAGRPALGVYYDIGNATAAGRDAASEIAVLGGRIHGVHIKDRPVGGPSVVLGAGDVHFEGVLDSLRAAGYDGPLILETPAGPDPERSAIANQAFLRDQVARSQPSYP